MKKKFIFIMITFLCIMLFAVTILLKFYNKKSKNGNNNIKEIEEHFLNINSYKAKIEVNVKSNKNENIYKIYQEVKNMDYCYQRIEEPENIKGMEFIYKNNKLEIRNSNLNTSKIYNNYPYITDNSLFLSDFIKQYKNSNSQKIDEKDNEFIIQYDNLEGNNNYKLKQILTINKQTRKPEKMEVLDINNKCRVFILYNEIEFNI